MLTCEACGHQMELTTCPFCQDFNLPAAKFCGSCGQKLSSAAVDPTQATNTVDPYDVDNRVLCSDESCIGIINERGVCTECGRPYTPHG